MSSSTYKQQSSQQAFRWHYAEFDDSNFQIRGRTIFFMVVLFSVIVLIGLLFFYARWICRITPPPPTVEQQSASFHAAPVRAGLDTETINSLPIVIYESKSGEFSENECCICLGVFGEKEEVKLLPECEHCFHSECVDKWLIGHSSCPLCRTTVRVDSVV